ncbi:SurA N-terminal domain-containing protein [Sphingomonas sp. GB1N7]|uniref:SurA N-terminal domain-containing protein n=1 Tax=Parasphingomonas caseinilytica TaxID=3096158 RepID=UPI002FCAE12B
MNRKTKFIAGTAAVLVLLSGCQKKVGGQVVAVVNGEEITQQQLNAELNGATLQAGADKKAVMAQLLQRVVDRTLLVQAAKADGLDQSPAYLEQARRQQDSLIVNMLAGKLSKNVPVPDSAAVSAFIASNPTMFAGRKRYVLDQIVFPQPSDMTLVRELQPAHSLEAIAAILTAKGIQFQRGNGQVDSGMLPPEVASKIAALPAGEPFLIPDNGRLVASVIKSAEAITTPEDQAKPAALNVLRQQALADAMRKQVTKARAAAKIEYQAGFAPPAGAAAGAAPATGAPAGVAPAGAPDAAPKI